MDGQAGPGQGQLLTTLAILQCDGKPTIALAAASRSFRPHPLLQLPGLKRRRRAFPTAIPSAPSLSGGRSGAGEGRGPRNRCADVYSLDLCSSRSRVCSPSLLGGGARVRRGTLLLWYLSPFPMMAAATASALAKVQGGG